MTQLEVSEPTWSGEKGIHLSGRVQTGTECHTKLIGGATQDIPHCGVGDGGSRNERII
jgi:hypothetical protein